MNPGSVYRICYSNPGTVSPRSEILDPVTVTRILDQIIVSLFFQIEGVRLYSKDDLLGKKPDGSNAADLFTPTPDTQRIPEKQETHSIDATKATEIQLKQFLESLCDELFGKDAEKRWVDAYFPFTHPSWELEVNE